MFGLSKKQHEHRGRIVTKWTFNAKSGLLSSAVIDDVNGDGKQEIVFGTKDGRVFCIDEEGKELWQYSAGEPMSETEALFYDTERIDSVPATPTIADVSGDGKKEILFGTEKGHVHCIDNKGQQRWVYKARGAVRSAILVDDLDGDGSNEVLFGTTEGEFIVASSTGKKKHAFELQDSIESEPAILRTKPETQLVFGTEKGVLYSYNALGRQLWTFHAKDAIRARVESAKLLNEGDIVVGDIAGLLYCLDREGNEQWRFQTGGAIYGAAALGDVNGDGETEVVVGSCDNKIYCFDGRGERLWSYETDFWVVSSPVITDLDNDGRVEIVAGSFDHHLYVLDGEGSYALDYMPGLGGVVHQAGSYGGIVTQEPGEQVGKQIWKIRTQGMIVGCSALDKGHIIVNVKSGEVDNITHTDAG